MSGWMDEWIDDTCMRKHRQQQHRRKTSIEFLYFFKHEQEKVLIFCGFLETKAAPPQKVLSFCTFQKNGGRAGGREQGTTRQIGPFWGGQKVRILARRSGNNCTKWSLKAKIKTRDVQKIEFLMRKSGEQQ